MQLANLLYGITKREPLYQAVSRYASGLVQFIDIRRT